MSGEPADPANPANPAIARPVPAARVSTRLTLTTSRPPHRPRNRRALAPTARAARLHRTGAARRAYGVHAVEPNCVPCSSALPALAGPVGQEFGCRAGDELCSCAPGMAGPVMFAEPRGP